MEAILSHKKIELVSFYSIDNKEARVRAIYDSVTDYEKGQISKLFINYDEEILDQTLFTLVISSYSGEYPIFHVFNTDKLYISDITRYVVELFANQRKEEGDNE